MTDTVAVLDRGRKAYVRAAWREAFQALSEADRAAALSAQDLEALGRSAYMVGDTDAYVAALERAYRAHLEAGAALPAVRLAFWIGHSLLFRAQPVPAGGWFARAQRIFDESGEDGAERGWMLIPAWLQQMGIGDYESGYATAGEAADIARRFDDADLLWLARGDQGRALINMGRVADGLRLVDEMYVVAIEGQLSPVVTGIVYCNTIAYCVDGYALDHAREWTEALTRWCEGQPEMEEHFGFCLVHRAELHHLSGSWAIAHEESERAAARHTVAGQLNQLVRGKAAYVQGEIHRLAGDFAAAERSFREANALGFEPQPGLALLRLMQGSRDSAAAAIRRATGESTQMLRRARLLPAFVEITVAVGELDRARAAVEDLEAIASTVGGAVAAMADCAKGALLVARDEPREALMALRPGLAAWQRLGVPYEAARARVLIGLACRELGDHDTAELELDTARAAFGQLGAKPDQARVDALVGRDRMDDGLTVREIDVLRLVASGRSNSEIAAALVISEHTVARHLQNIFGKLGVSTRTAAAAYAFEHRLT
ncbi:LuxR C-terminal-related transcriptional regulator [Nocardioides sp. HM23]|uniref:helix-turn-helix transcriptional regulator n=1 Tax=Nocardioides bizhenqiangii TaxID=3095076 RepID=UPI002ACB0262|nr:LuxR C-terminal-related transcriptional regulator [Nocardioides sp. HM23]MDZ5620744.1 LuxR C-terminal-related transcriptional regulator [Nocardioides sp. HM23]